MNRRESHNASKVSNLIHRYEELAKTNYIRPFLRRWMSTNSTNVSSSNTKSSTAQRIDKVAIPRNKPSGNGCQKPGINGSNDSIKKTVDEEVRICRNENEPNSAENPQSSTFQKNSKISIRKYDHIKSNNEFHTDSKKKPLKAAHSIEDFEELIYFEEITKEQLKTSYEISSETTSESSIELARKRAKKEEERYRISFIDEIINEDLNPPYEISSGAISEITIELARKRAKEEEEKYRRSFDAENEEVVIRQDNEIDDKSTEAGNIEDERQEINNIASAAKTYIKKDKKEFIVDELISSERIYIGNLELVIKNYLQYLKHQKYDNETIKIVFSNIESIHERTQIFLLHLENCNYNYAEIGKVFCKHRELFDKYPKYCRERNKSYNMIATDLKLIVAHRQLKLDDKLGLNSSLLKPIQRLAKYELLLINLNNILLEEGTTVASIQNAITLIQRTARIADTMVILNKILRCPYNYNDIGPLILVDEFRLLNPEKIDTTVFLFGKMLIFSEKATVKEEYNYRHSIPIDALRFNRPKNGSILVLEKYNNKIKKPTSTYTLETKDTKVLNAWFKEINQILWKQLETFKGNAQREAFTSSLNHFKSIDKVDNSEKSPRTATNGISNKNSVDDEKYVKVATNNKNQLKVPTNKHSIEKPSSPKNSHIVKSTEKKQVKSSVKENDRKKNINRKMALIHRM